jgi:hypothetical protein
MLCLVRSTSDPHPDPGRSPTGVEDPLTDPIRNRTRPPEEWLHDFTIVYYWANELHSDQLYVTCMTSCTWSGGSRQISNPVAALLCVNCRLVSRTWSETVSVLSFYETLQWCWLSRSVVTAPTLYSRGSGFDSQLVAEYSARGLAWLS